MMRRLVILGASWGGLAALQRVLGALKPTYTTPMVIAIHRPEGADGTMLCELLQSYTHLRVVEADDKAPIEASTAYIAPAGYHLLIDEGMRLSLSTQAPEHFSRPSIDLLLMSAADELGIGVVAGILTGTGSDGARGIQAVKASGGLTLAQDPTAAKRSSMPDAAIATGSVDRVLDLEQMAGLIEVACA